MKLLISICIMLAGLTYLNSWSIWLNVRSIDEATKKKAAPPNAYTVIVDGTNEKLEYEIYDGDKLVGKVKTGQLDSLILNDNK